MRAKNPAFGLVARHRSSGGSSRSLLGCAGLLAAVRRYLRRGGLWSRVHLAEGSYGKKNLRDMLPVPLLHDVPLRGNGVRRRFGGLFWCRRRNYDLISASPAGVSCGVAHHYPALCQYPV